MIWFFICRIWAFHIAHVIGSWGEQIGLPSWAGARTSGVSPGLPFPWASVDGPSRLFSNPINCPLAFAYDGRACARAVSFLESDATSTC